jgi:hypothetical protein
MIPADDIHDALEHRLPGDTPDWLREGIESALFFANLRGKYRMAEIRDVVPGAKVAILRFRKTDRDFRFHPMQEAVIGDPATEEKEGLVHVNWTDDRGVCGKPLDDFLLLDEDWPQMGERDPHEIVLVGSDEDDSGND